MQTYRRVPGVACLVAVLAVTCSTLTSAVAQDGERTHRFKINNGLVPPDPVDDAAERISQLRQTGWMDYRGVLTTPDGSRHDVELYWLVPEIGKTLQPFIWEPTPGCATPLEELVSVDAFWVFAPQGTGTGGHGCDRSRRLGGEAGINLLKIKTGVDGNTLVYEATVVLAPPAVETVTDVTGPLLADHGRRLGEQTANQLSFERFDGLFLVTNSGLYRGHDQLPNLFGSGFTVIETTDTHAGFRQGDAGFRARRPAVDNPAMTLIPRERSLDGTVCPDTDGAPIELRLRRLDIHAGVLGFRAWQADDVTPKRRECALIRIDTKTCRELECVQWSDELKSPGDSVYILTTSEDRAREIWASIPKWTLANRGYTADPSTYREDVRTRRSGGPLSPWGDCGLEGCDSARRREQIEQILIDIWSQQ